MSWLLKNRVKGRWDIIFQKHDSPDSSLLSSKVDPSFMSTHGCCSGPLPPENTFLLVLSNARQKMLDRCSPFSLIGLAREWMDFSMSHSSTLRSSPPERHNEGGKRETLTFRNHSIPHCLETFYIGDSNYQNNYELMQQLKTELLDPHRPQRSPKHKGKRRDKTQRSPEWNTPILHWPEAQRTTPEMCSANETVNAFTQHHMGGGIWVGLCATSLVHFKVTGWDSKCRPSWFYLWSDLPQCLLACGLYSQVSIVSSFAMLCPKMQCHTDLAGLLWALCTLMDIRDYIPCDYSLVKLSSTKNPWLV